MVLAIKSVLGNFIGGINIKTNSDNSVESTGIINLEEYSVFLIHHLEKSESIIEGFAYINGHKNISLCKSSANAQEFYDALINTFRRNLQPMADKLGLTYCENK